MMCDGHVWLHICLCVQAEEDEARLNEAQQEAEDAAELEAMRESGMLSGDPAAAAPKPAGKANLLGLAYHNEIHRLV